MLDSREALLSSHASCCIIQQFFQYTNFFRDDFLVVTAFQFVKSQTVFSLLYVVPFYDITFKTKVNCFSVNRQLFFNFLTFIKKLLVLFPNFIKKDSELESKILIILFLVEFDFITILNFKLISSFLTDFSIDIKHPINPLLLVLRNSINFSNKTIIFLNRVYFF